MPLENAEEVKARRGQTHFTPFGGSLAVAVQKGPAMISARKQIQQCGSRVSSAPQQAQTTCPAEQRSDKARYASRTALREAVRLRRNSLIPYKFDKQSTERETRPNVLDVREAFARRGLDDTKTAAVIGRGYAFRKMHSACPWKRVFPSRSAHDSWSGACGTTVR